MRHIYCWTILYWIPELCSIFWIFLMIFAWILNSFSFSCLCITRWIFTVAGEIQNNSHLLCSFRRLYICKVHTYQSIYLSIYCTCLEVDDRTRNQWRGRWSKKYADPRAKLSFVESFTLSIIIKITVENKIKTKKNPDEFSVIMMDFFCNIELLNQNNLRTLWNKWNCTLNRPKLHKYVLISISQGFNN